jgi:PAS domain S-box-containing protein
VDALQSATDPSVSVMTIKSAVDRKMQIAFGSAMAILIVVGAFAYYCIVVFNENNHWVNHTHEVLDKLQELRFSVKSSESSSRDFVMTGEESRLVSFRESVARANHYAEAANYAIQDNSVQQRKLSGLKALMARRIQLIEAIIRLRQTEGLDAAVREIETGPGERMSHEFYAEVDAMRDEELQLLQRRMTDSQWRLDETKTVLLVGTVLGLLITAGAGWSVRRDNSERALAEEALRAGEEQHRMDLSEVRDYSIITLDPQGRILTWNAGAERIKGYRAEEIIGQNFSRFFTAEDIAMGRPKDVLRIAAANGRHEEQNLRVRKDGSKFLARATFTALHDAAGKLRGFSDIIHDLSEATDSEAKYRGLMEAAPDAMVVVNQTGDIVLLNVQAEKQFGYRRDELLGQKVKNIIPDGFAERLIADDARTAAEALAQQIGTGIELSGRRKDGSEFPLELMLSPLESAGGILVTAAIRDISVRKAAEQHLAQMEGRYRGLLEAAPDAMVVVNQGGDIVLLNVRAEKQFGYRRDELLGQKVKNIIPTGFAERLVSDGLRSAEDALAQKIGTGIELSGRRKDGSEFPLELMLSPLESAEGILVTAAIRDISVRKAAEADLRQNVQDLNHSNQELEQFANIASHDLQEPLRMVASYTQLLARRYKGKLDSDADEFIAYAVDGASRMQRLIQDLLAYSRVGSKSGSMREISSENALLQALQNLRGVIQDSGALVTHEALPAVIADEIQLIQLFQNLVGNAIKYQNSGIPRVQIAATRNGAKRWTFSVKDNGLGIEPQYFEKIFGMFQRLHKREEFAGTGIGLAICKKIVERHGGRISVESQLGMGSTFRFALAEGETKR